MSNILQGNQFEFSYCSVKWIARSTKNHNWSIARIFTYTSLLVLFEATLERVPESFHLAFQGSQVYSWPWGPRTFLAFSLYVRLCECSGMHTTDIRYDRADSGYFHLFSGSVDLLLHFHSRPHYWYFWPGMHKRADWSFIMLRQETRMHFLMQIWTKNSLLLYYSLFVGFIGTESIGVENASTESWEIYSPAKKHTSEENFEIYYFSLDSCSFVVWIDISKIVRHIGEPKSI